MVLFWLTTELAPVCIRRSRVRGYKCDQIVMMLIRLETNNAYLYLSFGVSVSALSKDDEGLLEDPNLGRLLPLPEASSTIT